MRVLRDRHPGRVRAFRSRTANMRRYRGRRRRACGWSGVVGGLGCEWQLEMAQRPLRQGAARPSKARARVRGLQRFGGCNASGAATRMVSTELARLAPGASVFERRSTAEYAAPKVRALSVTSVTAQVRDEDVALPGERFECGRDGARRVERSGADWERGFPFRGNRGPQHRRGSRTRVRGPSDW